MVALLGEAVFAGERYRASNVLAIDEEYVEACVDVKFATLHPATSLLIYADVVLLCLVAARIDLRPPHNSSRVVLRSRRAHHLFTVSAATHCHAMLLVRGHEHGGFA